MGRYPGFYRKLKMSQSKEIIMLVKMIENGHRSTTFQLMVDQEGTAPQVFNRTRIMETFTETVYIGARKPF